MKKSQITSIIIATITLLGPLRISLIESYDIGIRGGLMVLSIVGILVAIFIGIQSPVKA